MSKEILKCIQSKKDITLRGITLHYNYIQYHSYVYITYNCSYLQIDCSRLYFNEKAEEISTTQKRVQIKKLFTLCGAGNNSTEQWLIAEILFSFFKHMQLDVKICVTEQNLVFHETNKCLSSIIQENIQHYVMKTQLRICHN